MEGISEIEASPTVYGVERRNLYPFLSQEEMRGWREDDGTLRIRWFGWKRKGKMVGVAAWEVYDVHQYQEGGPRYTILDLYTIEVEGAFRGQGIGEHLFRVSLQRMWEGLEANGFKVGALQIETTTARGFYEKVLSALGLSYKVEEREMVSGNPIYVFWVTLEQGRSE